MQAWYVVHTKPRKESLAEANLQRQDFETCLPWHKRATRNRGIWRETIEPLFPRYLFLRIDPNQQTVAPIRSTLGVSTLVTFGHRLAPVSDDIIDDIRQNADAQTGVQRAPEHQFNRGDAVAITAGPFGGLQGVFETSSSAQRVAVLLDILGKSAKVVLNQSHVEPAQTTRLPPGRQICGR